MANKNHLPISKGALAAIVMSILAVTQPAFSETATPPANLEVPRNDFMIVDLMQIITEALASQDIQKQLGQKSSEYQKEFANQDQKFRSENDKLVASQTQLKPEEFQKKQMDLQKRFEGFQEKIDLRRRQLEISYRNAMLEVQKKVDQLIERLAAQKKLSRVYREAAFAWVHDLKKVDMTPEILSLLNKELPKVLIKIPTEKEILALNNELAGAPSKIGAPVSVK